MLKTKKIKIAIILVLMAIAWSQITFLAAKESSGDRFVIMILRYQDTQFIDSPEAICNRNLGIISRSCSASVLEKINKEATHIARLPYLSFMEQIANFNN